MGKQLLPILFPPAELTAAEATSETTKTHPLKKEAPERECVGAGEKMPIKGTGEKEEMGLPSSSLNVSGRCNRLQSNCLNSLEGSRQDTGPHTQGQGPAGGILGRREAFLGTEDYETIHHSHAMMLGTYPNWKMFEALIIKIFMLNVPFTRTHTQFSPLANWQSCPLGKKDSKIFYLLVNVYIHSLCTICTSNTETNVQQTLCGGINLNTDAKMVINKIIIIYSYSVKLEKTCLHFY
ncbi:unnamed protein product [Lepidochelys kempii]